MVNVAAIDTMNRPTYAKPEFAKPLFNTYEFHALAETTFGGIKHGNDIPDGKNWQVLEVLGHDGVDKAVNEMAEARVEYISMDQLMQWSRRNFRLPQML